MHSTKYRLRGDNLRGA